MTKTFVSEAFGRIADRAVQIHGARASRSTCRSGASTRTRAPRASTMAPREVHRMTIARELLKLAMQGESTKAATGDLADGPRDRAGRHRPHPRGGRGQRARRRCSSLDPLLAFLDAHGPRRRRAGFRARRRGHSNVDLPVRPRRRAPSSCAARRARRCRPAPTTCCARRACCARSRAARACRGCWRSARTRRDRRAVLRHGGGRRARRDRRRPARARSVEERRRIGDELIDALVEIHARRLARGGA